MNDAAFDYRKTLNLPRTEFAMQANLAAREPERLARWQAEHLYQQVQAASAGRKPYRLVDGPPYANGDIHIGHAVNKVLKDIAVKAARLDGFQAPFVPGWDCHGLPIELQVEKQFGKVGEKQDAATFRQRCREYAQAQIERQRQDFRRLGVLADWDRPYLTMNPRFEAEQLRVLARIVENGHVVRGFKPVHWCLDCHSSLAEAEVEYLDKTSPAIDVAFAVIDSEELGRRFAVAAVAADCVIWTTTPWTLPANQAIAVHPEIEYALVEGGGRRLVLAAGLIDAAAARYDFPLRVLGTAKGAALEGLRARHPFADREVPIILGEHVTLEAGTGLVHTAPAHGLEDYTVGQRYRLPADNPVGADGVFINGAPLVAGVHVRKADAPIIEALRKRGALLHLGTVTHSYPHCWRHKTPLIFRATPQWFVSMDAAGLRDGALRAIVATRWVPGWGENRIREMVAGRPDWCISRQRYWGVPMAVFVHRREQTLHPDTPRLLRRIADAVERNGLEAWFDSTAGDWLGAEAVEYERCSDTLDVWFDSGSVHQCSFVAAEPEALDTHGLAPQADLYLEGSDQHRGWFQSSLLTCVAMRGQAPYRTVLTHGFTVDEQGRKMSKSLGNVIAPQAVIKTLGADVLRLWVAGSDYSGEIAISDTLLKRTADAYRRIRNTARFLLGNLHDFDPRRDSLPPDSLLAMDRWALYRASVLQQELTEAYRRFEFHLVCQRIHNYCVAELGGLYLDVLKDRLYTMPAASRGRRSAQTVIAHIAQALVRWIAPILSFTADEIWEYLPGAGQGSVFAQTWHPLPEVMLEAAELRRWQRLREIRTAVLKALETARNDGLIGGGLDAAVTLYGDGDALEAMRWLGLELRFWLIVSTTETRPLSEAPAGLQPIVLEEGGSVRVGITNCNDSKCTRCWQRRPEVGSLADHPGLCARCVENLAAGESRVFC